MKTLEELYDKCNSIGYTMYQINRVQHELPEPYKSIFNYYWGGGAVHPDNVYQSLLNGWYEDMKDGLGEYRSGTALQRLTDFWRNNVNPNDDGSSDKFFDVVVDLVQRDSDELRSNDDRKKLQRRNANKYKTIRILKTDIPKLVSAISRYDQDDTEFIDRMKDALGLDNLL